MDNQMLRGEALRVFKKARRKVVFGVIFAIASIVLFIVGDANLVNGTKVDTSYETVRCDFRNSYYLSCMNGNRRRELLAEEAKKMQATDFRVAKGSFLASSILWLLCCACFVSSGKLKMKSAMLFRQDNNIEKTDGDFQKSV